MNHAPEQLTAAFRAHEHLAPNASAALARIQAGAARRSRRRTMTALGAAAAVAAALGAVPLLLPAAESRTEPASVVAKAPTPVAGTKLEPGWMPPNTWQLDRVQDRRVGVKIYGGSAPVYLAAIARGATEFDAYQSLDGAATYVLTPGSKPLPAGEKVDINGKAGTYRGDARNAHVTWEISPGTWAGVNLNTREGDPARLRDQALRIARSIKLVP
jgi:hypothetical protein